MFLKANFYPLTNVFKKKMRLNNKYKQKKKKKM